MHEVFVDFLELILEIARDSVFELLLVDEELILPISQVAYLFLLLQIDSLKFSNGTIDLDPHIVVKLLNLRSCLFHSRIGHLSCFLCKILCS